MLCTRHGAAAVCVPCAFPVVSGSSRSSTTRCPAAEVHLIFPRTCSSWLPTAGCCRTNKHEWGQGSLAHEQCVWQVFEAAGLFCPTFQFDFSPHFYPTTHGLALKRNESVNAKVMCSPAMVKTSQIHALSSSWQSDTIPIPVIPVGSGDSASFDT